VAGPKPGAQLSCVVKQGEVYAVVLTHTWIGDGLRQTMIEEQLENSGALTRMLD
jgi:hypothetical protein